MSQSFEAADLLLHRHVTDISCSWDEGLAACCVESVNEAKDSTTSAIWIYPANGDAPWQMTSGNNQDNHPRWSPDGSQLAFISNRNGSMQLFLIPRDGGEARQLGLLDGVTTTSEWSLDGKTLLVIVSVQVDPNLRGARPGPDSPKPSQGDPQVAWKLPYKADGIGYQLGNESHLFAVDVATGKATQLTDGPFDVKCALFSADGKRILYTRSREGDESHRTDLWIMDRDGSNARQLTTTLAQVLFPAWSPDERWVVFSGTVEEGDAQVRLWSLELESGELQPLGDDSIEISNEGSSVQFVGKDSSRVLALIARRGVHAIAEITVPQGEIKWLVEGERQLSQLIATRDFLVYTAESIVSPMEVHACRHDGSGEKSLSQLNPWWQERRRATVERRYFEVPDGNGGTERIDGWLIRPEGTKGATPLLVDVHGGPASFTLFAYAPAAYWSMLWSKGWSILALNAVGSSSYGREFADRLRGRWGDIDLPQHLAAVKALQDEGLADQRVAMAGKSYGGFMSCWAAGHTDVFKAVVPMACLTQIDAHWGTSDSGYYSDKYAMKGDDAEARERMHDQSPVEYLRGSMVPTLLLHGKEDQRCPLGQAESAFVMLRRGGNQNCELVMYPEASHTFTKEAKPSHRVDVMQRIVEWVTRWTE
ncbi:S9 family peptidase [Comamonas endophytica]|uniref:S9 family peptidase n=2 Tax=Comamonas endophytica TaxID=2949090 RepID=A0ABY6GHF4_9BURK|nr:MULTISPECIES: S9 family peptidase [unclassified Acidovorax]MCD2513301.1 S9 family peptidase [Acidovorax sp. D4N7]UYG53912.1 S9 family peptidase [Acidovorax sp. 5MLIR]